MHVEVKISIPSFLQRKIWYRCSKRDFITRIHLKMYISTYLLSRRTHVHTNLACVELSYAVKYAFLVVIIPLPLQKYVCTFKIYMWRKRKWFQRLEYSKAQKSLKFLLLFIFFQGTANTLVTLLTDMCLRNSVEF